MHATERRSARQYLDSIAVNERTNLLEERHLGLFNGLMTTNPMFRDVLSFRQLFAPPLASPQFLLEARIFGERIPTRQYTWYPGEIRRRGEIEQVAVSSTLVLAAESRVALLAFTLSNHTDTPIDVPVQFVVAGGLDRITVWDFSTPASAPECAISGEGPLLKMTNPAGTIAVATDLEQPRWEAFSGHWEAVAPLGGKQTLTWHLAVAMGEDDDACEAARQALGDPEGVVARARSDWESKVADMFSRLPCLQAEDKRLELFYNRSLLHCLLNQWHVPEFKLDPYYSTGGLNGGCVCCYLWDFGANWELLNLYDPTAVKEHVKMFLGIDLTQHYAFSPVTGEALGPWYYINQEKIVFLIYHYVLLTGDASFLAETVNGRTILDWVVYQAAYGDDPAQPAVLMDYGKGNHHLELRREYRYDNVLPDMNARRCLVFQAAASLCRLAGQPSAPLVQRAKALKSLVTEALWSPENRWFFWLDENGQKHLRYTIQILKLIGTGILDADQEAGLLSHLNDDEFLSPYGIHSMSKTDPAYDQIDIDNGGGGTCGLFVGTLLERFYRAGYTKQADDLLLRVLWWGDRLPYWGDSLVANQKDYRKDTPLQNAIHSVSLAQSIIFGMLGVQVTADDIITISPRPPVFCPRITLTGLRIRGLTIDIETDGQKTLVRVDGEIVAAEADGAIRLKVAPLTGVEGL